MSVERAEDWERRQEECDAWYAELIEDPDRAYWLYRTDYGAHEAFLADLDGDVLDVGGGNGVVRHFLPAARSYVSLEPSTIWLRPDWAVLADRFPCLAAPPPCVRGVAEHIPFADTAFDAVLSFWSLNHVLDPAHALGEMGRVLKPDGKLLVVLEDMPPRWGDLLGPLRRDRGARYAGGLALSKLKRRITGSNWPIQSDHIRISEEDLERWTAKDLERVRREWVGAFLTFEFRKRSESRRLKVGRVQPDARPR
jgi:SAM-dependent methyltransferase